MENLDIGLAAPTITLDCDESSIGVPQCNLNPKCISFFQSQVIYKTQHVL